MTKEELLAYTSKIVELASKRILDKISAEELESRLMDEVNVFLKKYGK